MNETVGFDPDNRDGDVERLSGCAGDSPVRIRNSVIKPSPPRTKHSQRGWLWGQAR